MIAVDIEMLQTLLGDVPYIVTLSWVSEQSIAIPVDHLQINSDQFLTVPLEALVRIAYQR